MWRTRGSSILWIKIHMNRERFWRPQNMYFRYGIINSNEGKITQTNTRSHGPKRSAFWIIPMRHHPSWKPLTGARSLDEWIVKACLEATGLTTVIQTDYTLGCLRDEIQMSWHLVIPSVLLRSRTQTNSVRRFNMKRRKLSNCIYS